MGSLSWWPVCQGGTGLLGRDHSSSLKIGKRKTQAGLLNVLHSFFVTSDGSIENCTRRIVNRPLCSLIRGVMQTHQGLRLSDEVFNEATKERVHCKRRFLHISNQGEILPPTTTVL